jgi:transcriptional regulator with XRE-family HTH domain
MNERQQARYRRLFDEAESDANYWLAGPVLEFSDELCQLMEEKKVSRAELARRIGTSRAYITKLLGGGANFTLLTMVRLAMALDGALHVHISDKRAVTRWQDLSPEEAAKQARKKARKRSRKSKDAEGS